MLKSLFKKIPLPLIVLLLFFGPALPFLGMYCNSLFEPNPPLPEITYGEFPFRLEYEINGERIVIEDTVICKFDGVGVDVFGKHLKWKRYLASGIEWVTLYYIDDLKSIRFITGSAQYYLGEYEKEGEDIADDKIYIYEKPNSGIIPAGKLISLDELRDIYGITIISWQPSPPIESTFK